MPEQMRPLIIYNQADDYKKKCKNDKTQSNLTRAVSQPLKP